MKRSLATLALLAVLALPAYAQSSADVNSTVTANVVSGLSASELNALTFDDLVANTSATINSKSTEAGKIQVAAAPEQELTFMFVAPAMLEPTGDGTGVVGFSADTPTYNTSDNATSSTFFAAPMAGTATTGTDGNLFIYFGGTADATGASADTYTGVYNITITYANL